MTIGMNLISWIVVGLIAGFLAGRVMREGGYGLIGDIVVGIIGGLIGGYLATNLLHIKQTVTGINLESVLIAFFGAVVLLVGLRLLGGSRRGHRILR